MCATSWQQIRDYRFRTLIVNALVAVAPPAATCTVKLNEPGFVGVPLITPPGVNDKPGGRGDGLGGMDDHAYDPVPPLAASVAE
jgi:hypothetical protein